MSDNETDEHFRAAAIQRRRERGIHRAIVATYSLSGMPQTHVDHYMELHNLDYVPTLGVRIGFISLPFITSALGDALRRDGFTDLEVAHIVAIHAPEMWTVLNTLHKRGYAIPIQDPDNPDLPPGWRSEPVAPPSKTPSMSTVRLLLGLAFGLGILYILWHGVGYE